MTQVKKAYWRCKRCSGSGSAPYYMPKQKVCTSCGTEELEFSDFYFRDSAEDRLELPLMPLDIDSQIDYLESEIGKNTSNPRRDIDLLDLLVDKLSELNAKK